MSEVEPIKDPVEKRIIAAEEATTVSAPSLAFRATLLDERAYRIVKADPEPFKRGGVALLVAVGLAALGRLVAIALGVLTMPRIGVVQDQIFAAITGTGLYAQLVTQTPEFPEQFATGYTAAWELIRLFGGYPSYAGLASALISLLLLLGSWLLYGTAVHWIARWFGSDAGYGRTLGVLALAYTPILLSVVEAIPGANVPYLLLFALMLIAKFLAIKTLYNMGPGQNLAIAILPYVGGLVLLITILLFATAFGLNQFPIIDDFLRTLRFAQAVR